MLIQIIQEPENKLRNSFYRYNFIIWISYRHTDYEFNDFAVQRLLPQKYSQLGPFITTGDIDKDGKIDFFIGGGCNIFRKNFFAKL